MKRKVSIRHSLDTSITAMNASVAQSRGLNVSGNENNNQHHGNQNNGNCNPYFRSILSSKRTAGSETNIGSITLATATGSTPAIKLEVGLVLLFVSLYLHFSFFRLTLTPFLRIPTFVNMTFSAALTQMPDSEQSSCPITVTQAEASTLPPALTLPMTLMSAA